MFRFLVIRPKTTGHTGYTRGKKDVYRRVYPLLSASRIIPPLLDTVRKLQKLEQWLLHFLEETG